MWHASLDAPKMDDSARHRQEAWGRSQLTSSVKCCWHYLGRRHANRSVGSMTLVPKSQVIWRAFTEDQKVRNTSRLLGPAIQWNDRKILSTNQSHLISPPKRAFRRTRLISVSSLAANTAGKHKKQTQFRIHPGNVTLFAAGTLRGTCRQATYPRSTCCVHWAGCSTRGSCTGLKTTFFVKRGDFSQDSFALCQFCFFSLNLLLFGISCVVLWLLWLLQLVWFLLVCLLSCLAFVRCLTLLAFVALLFLAFDSSGLFYFGHAVWFVVF